MQRITKLAQSTLENAWIELNSEILKSRRDWRAPGVYLLAYQQKLAAKRPIDDLELVFYVGMSRAKGGVKTRLKQFLDGIESNISHSAAKRFYRDYANSTQFSKFEGRKKFFVCVKTIKCNPNKTVRTPADLRKIGEIVCLEYFLLAAIKEEIGREPHLNQQ